MFKDVPTGAVPKNIFETKYFKFLLFHSKQQTISNIAHFQDQRIELPKFGTRHALKIK